MIGFVGVGDEVGGVAAEGGKGREEEGGEPGFACACLPDNEHGKRGEGVDLVVVGQHGG